MPGNAFRRMFFQNTDRSRCREQPRDLVLRDDAPPACCIGTNRQTFVEHRRHAGDQRRIDDVRMSDDPAHVRGAKESATGAIAEQRLHRLGQRHCIAADVALHALGLAGGAGGIEDVRTVGGVEPGDRHLRIDVSCARRGVIDIAPGHGLHRRHAAIDDQCMRRFVFRQLHRFVQQRLVGNHLAAARPRIGRDDQHRLGVIDARGKTVRRKTTEDHRVDRADPCAGEHREDGLGDHRHVDQDPVAALYTERKHDRRTALDLCMQFAVGIGLVDRRTVGGFRRDRDQRQCIRLFRQPAVDGVVAEIGLAADEPAGEWRMIVIEDAVERTVPVDAFSRLGPEFLRFIDRLPIIGVVIHLVSPVAWCAGRVLFYLPTRPVPAPSPPSVPGRCGS